MHYTCMSLQKNFNNNEKLKKKDQDDLEEISDDGVVKPINTIEIHESLRNSKSSNISINSRITSDSSSEDEVADHIETKTAIVNRSTRVRRPKIKYFPLANYLMLTEDGEPEPYLNALTMKDFIQWKKDM